MGLFVTFYLTASTSPKCRKLWNSLYWFYKDKKFYGESDFKLFVVLKFCRSPYFWIILNSPATHCVYDARLIFLYQILLICVKQIMFADNPRRWIFPNAFKNLIKSSFYAGCRHQREINRLYYVRTFREDSICISDSGIYFSIQ